MNDMTMKDAMAPAGVPEIHLSRVFDAPRALVFKCWIEPGHLARWWGPKDFTNPVCEGEARPGGAYRIVMKAPDGGEHAMKGVFREIVPNEKIVKEDDLSEHSAESHDLYDPKRDTSKPPEFKILTTVIFADEGNKTRVTIRQRFSRVDIRDNVVKIGIYEGWSESFDKLDDIAAALKDSDREFNISRVLAYPREVVFRCFHDPDNMGKWWGPNGFRTTVHKYEFRVGGTRRFTMHGPDGTDYDNRSVFTAINVPSRIEYDHYAGDSTELHFHAVITFAEVETGTRVNLRLIVADAGTRDGFVKFGAVEGGYQTLARLAEYLARN